MEREAKSQRSKELPKTDTLGTLVTTLFFIVWPSSLTDKEIFESRPSSVGNKRGTKIPTAVNCVMKITTSIMRELIIPHMSPHFACHPHSTSLTSTRLLER